MSTEITASDLVHLPHVVVVKRFGESRCDVLEFDSGKEAHACVHELTTEEVESVRVCVRIRTLYRPPNPVRTGADAEEG